MADIPGIIEGASQGKGLGLRFLRHIERNSVLLFMVPVTADDIRAEYNTLVNELHQYNPELADKNRLLAITKTDLVTEEELVALKKMLPERVECVFISAINQQGLTELKDAIWQTLADAQAVVQTGE